MPIILHIPFDESRESLVAHDFSINNKHGYLRGTGMSFVPAKHEYGIKFTDGSGYVKIKRSIPFINDVHTFAFWYKTPDISGINSLSFEIALEDDTILQSVQNLDSNKWYYITFKRNALGLFKYYVNALHIADLDIDTEGEEIAQWAIKQGLYDGTTFIDYLTTPRDEFYGFGIIDDLKIWNDELTDSEILTEYLGTSKNRVWWSINGKDFIKEYSVHVEDSFGLVDSMDRKDTLTHDWAEYHGESIDVDIWRMKKRTIELNCWIKADGYMDFVNKMNDFLFNFQKAGLHRLKCEINEYKPLVWDVILESGTDIEKKWRKENMMGTFTLSVTEPMPVKRVVRFVATSGNMTCKINVRVKSVIVACWGDGAKTNDIKAHETAILTHTFENEGVYEVCVYCEPSEIVYWWTNGITIWNRL